MKEVQSHMSDLAREMFGGADDDMAGSSKTPFSFDSEQKNDRQRTSTPIQYSSTHLARP